MPALQRVFGRSTLTVISLAAIACSLLAMWPATASGADIAAVPEHRAADTTPLANGERPCSACHDSDLFTEHAKRNSSSADVVCDTCHVEGGARDQVGEWNRTCTDGGCHDADGTRPVHADYCLACHDASQPDFAFTKVDFEVAPVDRARVCVKCHWKSKHYSHGSTIQCNRCHYRLPGRSDFYYSSVSTPFGYFSASSSPAAGAAQLHRIHVNGSWPATVTKDPITGGATTDCLSCHAPAACESCHEDAVAHGGHTAGAYAPESYRVTAGKPVGSTALDTSYQTTSACVNASCHDLGTAVQTTRASFEQTDAAITYADRWSRLLVSAASGGSMTWTARAGASATFSFTGPGRVELIGGRNPFGGYATVTLNGFVVDNVDCFSGGTEYGSLLYASPLLGAGTHTVTLTATGTRRVGSAGAKVLLDRIDVIRPDSSAEPFAPACSSCHPALVNTHYTAAQHTASPGTGFAKVFDGGHDYLSGNVGIDAACSTCHVLELGPIHGNDCWTCHPQPYGTVSASWAQGCQQGGCHATYHTGPFDTHYENEDDNCSVCHPASWWPRPVDCLNCHAGRTSTSPPVTTSNARASYNGAALIDFSVTKGGKAAIATTRFRVDGGKTQTGSRAVVSSAGSHTLVFWSVDQNGITETSAKTATFAITSDTTPPVTTSNAGATYYQGALITLTPTDASTQGVKATYYTLNGGATQTGTTVSVPGLSGTIAYTLRFWSEDWSGNVETPKTANFTVTGGTGTLRLVWGDSDILGPPGAGSEAVWTVRRTNSSGAIVATGSGAFPGWSGVDNVVVPVRGTPYWVQIDWWDDYYGYWDQTVFGNVYVTTAGQVVRLSY